MAGNVYSLRSVEDEASEWVARLDRGGAPHQRKRFEAWLAADPRHRAVFDEMSCDWEHLSAVAQVAGRLSSPLAQTKTRGPARSLSIAMVAAAVAVTVVATALYVINKDSTSQVYTTAVGAQRTLTLADRSTVDLNTAHAWRWTSPRMPAPCA